MWGLLVFRSKRGTVVEVMLSPLFAIAIAVAVGIVVISSVGKIGSSDTFERRFVATDIALLLDSVGAVRDDTALSLRLSIPRGMRVEVGDSAVSVFGSDPNAPERFWYSASRGVQYGFGSAESFFEWFKVPGAQGVGSVNVAKAAVVCPVTPKGLRLDVARLDSLPGDAVELASGDAQVVVRASRASVKEAVLYVSSGGDVACVLAQKLGVALDGLDGVSIVPLRPEFVARGDARRSVLERENGVFVELRVPDADRVRALRGLYDGVRALE